MSLRVCVTGAAGQIAYSLLYALARGDVFGMDQPIELLLLDIPPMVKVMEGVVMELQDCALPLLKEVSTTADPVVAFTNIDICIMVGAMPRKQGMERKDLLKANAKIFETQGKALDAHAKKTVKVLVVGNPANTNALLCLKSAPSLPPSNFTCMTRLDQNRAQAQVAARLAVTPQEVHNVIIWGNHSSTQFPDVAHAYVEGQGGVQTPVYDAVKDDAWLKGEFITMVQKRGATVIEKRGLSSAMSAAKAIVDHMRSWWFGTKEGEWVSMGVLSDGAHYGIPAGVVYSFPVRIHPDHSWEVVTGLEVGDFARERMELSAKELLEERDTAVNFLSGGEQ